MTDKEFAKSGQPESRPPRPTAISPDCTSMPDELKALHQWVVWRYEWRDGAWTKVPVTPRTRRKAATTVPADWGTFHEAMEAFQRNPAALCGIGFVFAVDDPYTGVDLDKCRDPKTGVIEPWAEEIIDSLDSYGEVSPSGTGVKLIVRAKKPGTRCRKGPIEIYGVDRYFALTGQVLPRRRATIESRQEQLDALYSATFKQADKPAQSPPAQDASTQDDEAVLNNALGSKDGGSFASLWVGNTAGYASASEADLALCGKLAFWTQGNSEQIDRLFRRSELFREKWNRPDYRDKTIRKAIEGCNGFYDPDYYKTARQAPSSPAEPNQDEAAADASDAHRTAPDELADVTPARFEQFPVAALPKPIRDFVIKGAKALGCDRSYLVLTVLAVLAAAIGNSRRIRLKSTWTEPAIVWAIIIGESGAMKTPPYKLVIKALRRLQSLRFKEFAEAQKIYESERLKYEAELSAWKQAANKAAKEGRSESSAPPEEPVAPTCIRYLTSDLTIEALAAILAENWRGLLLARDEVSGLFKSFDAYRSGKGGDREHYLSMHSGEPLYVDRKTNRVMIHVPMAAVSIAGGTQPHILKRVMGFEERESGLLARMLMAMPPKRVKRWTDAELPESVERTFAEILDRLIALEPTVDFDGEPTPVLIDLTAEAKAAWVTFFNEHADEQVQLTGDLSAAWSKLEGYTARLALIIHLVRVVTCDSTIQNPKLVDLASIQGGVTIARWFCRETRRIYAFLQQTPEESNRDRVLTCIAGNGGSITARELQRHFPRLFRKAGQAVAELEALVTAGLGVWVREPSSSKGGAPTRRFTLTHTVDTTPAEEPVDTTDNDNTPSGDPKNGGSVNVSSVNTPQSSDSVNAPPPEKERRFL